MIAKKLRRVLDITRSVTALVRPNFVALKEQYGEQQTKTSE